MFSLPKKTVFDGHFFPSFKLAQLTVETRQSQWRPPVQLLTYLNIIRRNKMFITCEKKNEMCPWTRMVIENRVKIKIILFCYLFHETSCKLNCYTATQEEFLRVSQLIRCKTNRYSRYLRLPDRVIELAIY